MKNIKTYLLYLFLFVSLPTVLSAKNVPNSFAELAEKLIEIHPTFNMVKFARSGGEANSIAIRIARAASARDNVAICGYHAGHDGGRVPFVCAGSSVAHAL